MPDAATFARLHSACFTSPRPWSTAEIASLLESPLVFALAEPNGFLMARVIADEAEVLTLAVHPSARRQGIGARLLAGFLETTRARGAATAFLEVAADNAPAFALYRGAGFTQTGRRAGYYMRPDGTPIDAALLSRAI